MAQITVVAAPPPSAEPQPIPEPRALKPRRPRSIPPAEVGLAMLCAASSASLVWFIWYEITGFSGAASFVIASILVFLGMYYFANRQLFGHTAHRVREEVEA